MSEQLEIADAGAKPVPRYVTARKMYLTVIMVSIIVSIASVVSSIAYYDRHYATKILVYDLTSKLKLIEKSASEGKITFQQADQVAALEILEAKKLADSAPPNYVVITGDAVLGSHAQNIGQ